LGTVGSRLRLDTGAIPRTCETSRQKAYHWL